MKKLMIIGGGASGLAAAVAAGEALAKCIAHGAQLEPVEVVVCEADGRVGRSILATGNGRCNFSNARIDASKYRNGRFVGEALDELRRQRGTARADALGRLSMLLEDSDPVHAFFADLGLVWREEGEGRLYPLANKATSVLDVLRTAVADLSVREECNSKATRIDVPTGEGERFHVRFADGAVEHAEAVIVAVGGCSVSSLAFGGCALNAMSSHSVLGPLHTDEDRVKPLNNIRVRCAVSLVSPDGTKKAREEGEVLFRDYGVSGIAVFNLSRFAEPDDCIVIDALPQFDASSLESLMLARLERLRARKGACTADDVLRGMVLPVVGRAVSKSAGLRFDDPLSPADATALARSLKNFALVVHGVGDARQCQVQRGGFAVEAFDPRTLEAHDVSGLYVAGEALDVDAPCGGYNLHWAWASGVLAGRAAIARLMGKEDVCA